jgi:lipopolysaccharide transport system ATP-binding protein
LDEEFWALKNVTFELEQGERLGIIGRNGAGKSTLLKLLSRVSEPTEGKIEIHGRVSSLLEVGTGFHPELTGRENIFLNGTILGMSARQIRAKFDEIVAFAEVEKFLDTPVKRYSSGMYVRLAFAVAAHLEPDILIVDEVLAVGDAEFQRKCAGRMEQLSGAGRTLIFVTHNMDAFVSLCKRGIVLDGGSVLYNGDALAARANYVKLVTDKQYSVSSNSGRGGSGGISIRDVWIEDGRENKTNVFIRGAALSLSLRADFERVFQNRTDVEFAFAIDTQEGRRLFTVISSWTHHDAPRVLTTPQLVVACDVDSIPLVPGRYLVSASIIFRGDTLDSIEHCASFDVLPQDVGIYAARPIEFGPLDLPCRFRYYAAPIASALDVEPGTS